MGWIIIKAIAKNRRDNQQASVIGQQRQIMVHEVQQSFRSHVLYDVRQDNKVKWIFLNKLLRDICVKAPLSQILHLAGVGIYASNRAALCGKQGQIFAVTAAHIQDAFATK